MYDIMFLSYDEANADINYSVLKSQFANIHRVHGIKGIREAHVTAAKMARTEMFFVVDADACNIDQTVFSFTVPTWDLQYTHIWYAHNLVNGAEYGYGGLKLFNTEAVLTARDIQYIDFSNSVGDGIKVIETVMSCTKFDSSAFVTFRSVVREIVKLALQPSCPFAISRLQQWRTPTPNTSHPAAYYMGVEVANTLLGNSNCSELINDYDYLSSLWDQQLRV